jgi:hypothetical protein
VFAAWNLRPIEIFYLTCAVVGGVLFLLRMILYVAGGSAADTDLDVDLHSDGALDHSLEPGIKIVSVQGVTGFFLMFGLIGLAMARGGIHDVWTILGGAAAGLAVMFVMAWIMLSMQRLQSSGTLKIENTIGREGKVYLTIPAEGTGKVSLAVQGNLREFEAVSDGKTAIPTGAAVRVVGLSGSRVLVVEQID